MLSRAARQPTGPHLPPEVARHLGFYVYLYIDPRDEKIFYVGKGKGRRLLAHLSARGEARKARTLKALRKARLKPRLEVLAHGLPRTLPDGRWLLASLWPLESARSAVIAEEEERTEE